MVTPQFCMGFSHVFCCLNQGFFWFKPDFLSLKSGSTTVRFPGVAPRCWSSSAKQACCRDERSPGRKREKRRTNGYQEIFGDHPIYDHHLHFLNQWTPFFSVAKSWSLWVNPLFLSVDARILIALINSGWWFGTWFLFFHDILGKFIPTDFHIFQMGWLNYQPVWFINGYLSIGLSLIGIKYLNLGDGEVVLMVFCGLSI